MPARLEDPVDGTKGPARGCHALAPDHVAADIRSLDARVRGELAGHHRRGNEEPRVVPVTDGDAEEV